MKLLLKLICDALKDWTYYEVFIFSNQGILMQIWRPFKKSNVQLCILFIYRCTCCVFMYLMYLFHYYCIKYICFYLILITHLCQCIKMYILLVIHFVLMSCASCNLLYIRINVFKSISSFFYFCIMYLSVFLFTIIYFLSMYFSMSISCSSLKCIYINVIPMYSNKKKI